MKLSALVSSYFIDDEEHNHLNTCLNSLKGADEILALVTHRSAPSSFAETWNKIATLADGDYLFFVGCHNRQLNGDLHDLCIPGVVTSPLHDGKERFFWGFHFCMPRDIYEKIGLYDLAFKDGANWEDEDLVKRLQQDNIPMQCVKSINFEHPETHGAITKDPRFNDRQAKNRAVFDEKWNQTNS